MRTWLLPDHIADVLPAEARRIELLRRLCLDAARSFGYELVMPPLLEHVDSLLTGTAQDLDLRTFKLTDQISGKTLGLRADITPQVARIDAHLLNRAGVTRLCYAGPVVHAVPIAALESREALLFGAEIYGHAGLEADCEAIELALTCLEQARLPAAMRLCVDLADARILDSLLATLPQAAADADWHEALLAALLAKNSDDVAALVMRVPLAASDRRALVQLTDLYGGTEVLDRALECLPPHPSIRQALADLRVLANTVAASERAWSVNVDLGDLHGYRYHSGATFMVYAQGLQAALVRGGRYDEVGQAFGRARPATGFSLFLGDLAKLSTIDAAGGAIRAPRAGEPALRRAVAELRAQGQTVVHALPGHEHEPDEYHFDRELVADGQGGWTLRPLADEAPSPSNQPIMTTASRRP
jgi:ATP phosphoribosyltransferase regulatory subunit